MSSDKNNISGNNDSDKDFTNRINRLLDKDKELPSDDELTQRFKKVFHSQPTVSEVQKLDYSIPSSAHDEEVEQYLLEAQLLQSDNSDEDDDYLAGILNRHAINVSMEGTSTIQGEQQPQHQRQHQHQREQRQHDKTLKAWQSTFMGTGHRGEDIVVDDRGHELIQQLKDQVAVESKYAAFEQQRDDELERRYLALKKDSDDIINSRSSPSSQGANQASTSFNSSTSNPPGVVPKPLEFADLHDEMDDWCCVCNEDAVIECDDCDNDRFCRQCFYDGHQSDMADYGFSKHRAKKYTK